MQHLTHIPHTHQWCTKLTDLQINVYICYANLCTQYSATMVTPDSKLSIYKLYKTSAVRIVFFRFKSNRIVELSFEILNGME